MITFLLLGIAGLPVFSGGTSGIGVVIGPRGGYLIGFLIGSIIISLLKGKDNNPYRLLFSNIIGGIVVLYLIGFLWLAITTKMGLYAAFISGVLPFIPGDVLKVIAATFISYSINKRRVTV
jgi:biotin transport system substrate-specific component